MNKASNAADRRTTQRDALANAAERIIAENGLSMLRARDLAQEAGCAVGAIYNLFPDLDALVLEVNRRTLSGLRDALARRGGELDGSEAATDEIVRLATTYLAFAQENRRRWRALFQHAMADGRPLPDWYADATASLFRVVEEPIGVLCPEAGGAERQRLARTLFSAVHGIVDLGLDEKLTAIAPAQLDTQLQLFLRATAKGLATGIREQRT